MLEETERRVSGVQFSRINFYLGDSKKLDQTFVEFSYKSAGKMRGSDVGTLKWFSVDVTP